MANQRVKFNVSGNIFETLERTLRRFPKTLLGDPRRRSLLYDEFTKTYFINRSSVAFEAVLFFYQSNGCLVRPPFLPMILFESECIFYELGAEHIKQMKEREGVDTQGPEPVYKKRLLLWLWDLVEHPESSVFARLFTFTSLICIFTTVGLDCLETIPGLLYDNKESTAYENTEKLKFALNVFFAVEFTLRLISCPKVRKFLLSVGNIIDILAIFPSFLTHLTSSKDVSGIYFTRVLRTFRIFRLMRLSRSFHTLSVVLHIISNSIPNLLMLLACMLISIILFGSAIYYTELDAPNTPVISIPEGMWLAMVTVVSVGYGDVIPLTSLGKLMASITAVIGALTMTLPLLSLGGKYFSMYTKTFDIDLSTDDIKKPTETAVQYSKKINVKSRSISVASSHDLLP